MWLFSFDKEYKGWSFERVSRHIVWWCFWLTFYTVINGSYANQYGDFLLLELMVMAVKIPFVYVVVYYLFPKLLPEKRYFALGASMIVLALVGVAGIVEINKTLPPEIQHGQPTSFWNTKAFFRALDLIYGVSLVVVIKMVQQFFQQRRLNAQLKEEKANAELQNLKNQLQPHFLFNTLNNIYGMVLSGNREAADSVLRLSSIMSYMLHECEGTFVALEKELELIKNYIELEKLRYGDLLDVSMETAGCIKGRMIAPLLLLPFVENAFKHGVSASEKHAWVRINVLVTDDELTFFVENSIPCDDSSFSPVKSGIGLANVRQRLDLLYPQRHELKINAADTYLINLKIIMS